MLGRLRRGHANAVPLAVAFSVSLHLGIVAAGAAIVRHELMSDEAVQAAALRMAMAEQRRVIEIELPNFGVLDSDRFGADPGPADNAQAQPAHPGGVRAIPRPDTGSKGRGGTDTASKPAINLADRDDGLRLSPEIASRIDRDQVQRLATGKTRKSWVDERRTTHPMELTFLASGQGVRMERRSAADHDPSSGVERAPTPAVRGAIRLGSVPAPAGVGLQPRDPGGPTVGTASASPGQGVIDGAQGQDHRNSAAVASARPMVRPGPPSIPANEPGRPKDTVDATQEVAASVQSIQQASTAGGRSGEGPGGSKGAGPTGSGAAEGQGSRADALGQGSGGYAAADPFDPRLSMYRRRVLAKLWPLWEDAFPHWAIAEMRQGQVIIALVIQSDGTVRDPHVKRPSGIPEFDAKCLAAVRRAAPFEPLPSNLGVHTMQWDISFEASNPVVR
jgi:TonB family protein